LKGRIAITKGKLNSDDFSSDAFHEKRVKMYGIHTGLPFSNTFFAILCASLVFMFILLQIKSIAANQITLQALQ
jgi:hypothetical protein